MFFGGRGMSTTTSNWKDYDLSHFRHTTGSDIFDVHEHFDRWCADSRWAGYDQYLQSLTTAPTPRVQLHSDGDSLINLASYNYLGLSYHPRVVAAAGEALTRYGLGAAGSPHLSGLLHLHESFANEIAAFKGVEAALLFPSGYSANVGAISALVGAEDHVIADMNAHASIIDGCVLAQAKLSLFKHNSMRSLRRRLEGASGRVLVIVEGVYSMDGDVAPLNEIAALCQEFGARLMVDEAHSAFIYGETGKGLCETFGVSDVVDIHFGTLSKSLGGMGGYVAGSKRMIDYIRAYARSQVFFLCLVATGGWRFARSLTHRQRATRIAAKAMEKCCTDA